MSNATTYNIVVLSLSKGKFCLFNEASGGAVGPRLFKGEDNQNQRQQWPFKEGTQWTSYKTKKGAETAAQKLQSYLESCEGRKAKK